MKNYEKVTPYTEKEEIDKIVNILKDYSYDELSQTDYFKNSLMEKNTDENQLREVYSKFDRIKMILFRERGNGKMSNYDLYYELDNGQYILLAIDTKKTPPRLVNGYSCYKNLKKFIQQILKKYKKDML